MAFLMSRKPCLVLFLWGPPALSAYIGARFLLLNRPPELQLFSAPVAPFPLLAPQPLENNGFQCCNNSVPELRFGCSLLESQYSRDHVGWKGKAALFRRLATWGEGGLVSKNQLWRFCSTMKVFKERIIWGGGQSLHSLLLCADFLLIGWWWGDRAVLQESGAQPEVTILHLGGGLSSYRRTQRYCYVYSLRRNQDPTPSLHYCPLAAFPLFLIPSLPW